MDNEKQVTPETGNAEAKPTASKPQKKSTAKKVILTILCVLLGCLLAIGGSAAYTIMFHEPDTGVNDPPPFDTGMLNKETEAPDVTAGETGDQPSPESTDGQPAQTEPPKETGDLRSQQKIYNFLFVGQDRIALNTDVIMLISFNTTKNTINVLQIPRDTYIEADGYSGKINGMYANYYLNNGYDVRRSLRMFADRLEKSLCLKIHNVCHINLDGVVAIVDALGGVDVNVPNTITFYNETKMQWVTLNKGMNHLDGSNAENFIRHRATYLNADIGRIDAQKVFVSAFIQKVKNNYNVSTITAFADTAFKYVTTDVSVADAAFYAKQLLKVDMDKINMMSMVGFGTMSNADGTGLSLYVMVRKNMREMINSYFNIYDFEITDSIFDPDRTFTSTYIYPHINTYYNMTDVVTGDPHSAESLNGGSIYIPGY